MKKMNVLIGINEFVHRQTKGSGKTYVIDLTLDEIRQHAKKQLAKGQYKEGYRDGVILAKVDDSLLNHFICPFVKITEETKLKAEIVRRRPEEEPYIQIRALNGSPLKTNSVELILYRNDVLAETHEDNTDSDWELISFHAIPKGVIDMPMGPTTMMRNQLQLQGGTKAYYESEKWATSVRFWQEYAVLDETKD